MQHLVGLVDNLLDVSRITRGKIQLNRTTVDVANVVNAAAESADTPASLPMIAPTSSPRRILVVDDNPDAAAMLAAALKSYGHTVRVAHDGCAPIPRC